MCDTVNIDHTCFQQSAQWRINVWSHAEFVTTFTGLVQQYCKIKRDLIQVNPEWCSPPTSAGRGGGGGGGRSAAVAMTIGCTVFSQSIFHLSLRTVSETIQSGI